MNIGSVTSTDDFAFKKGRPKGSQNKNPKKEKVDASRGRPKGSLNIKPLKLKNNDFLKKRREMVLLIIEEWKKCKFWFEKKEHFNDQEIKQFQLDADNFWRAWKDAFGSISMTNYIGDLALGVDREFLKTYKNFYLYNNCGVEAYVGTIRAKTERGTNAGYTGKDEDGNVTKGSIVKSVECHQLIKLVKQHDMIRGKGKLMEEEFVSTGRLKRNVKQNTKRQNKLNHVRGDEYFIDHRKKIRTVEVVVTTSGSSSSSSSST
jgi:hypothetical protein